MMNATQLTPEQKIIVAYMHHIRGVTQQDLAAIYCINHGRINEACMAIGHAAGLTGPGYKEKKQ